MKYADPHEFASQKQSAASGSEQSLTLREKIRNVLIVICTKRNDPTRMSKVERKDSGLSETAVDWYNALHGPLVK
jgi:hypothetical protein